MTPPRSLIRFGMTGLACTGLHVLVAATLTEALQQNPVLSNGVAFCVANIFSFFANARWSFGARPTWRALRRFLSVSGFGVAATLALAALAQHAWHSHWAGIALVVVVVPPASYLLHRFFTFRESP